MSRKQARLKKQLNDILKTEPHSLRAEVAREALDYGEELRSFFSDLLTYGCQSGMVGALIYYADTHEFYDTHYDAIENIRYELEESIGEPLQPKGDLKNWFAWLAFEETARAMAEELGF